MCKRLTTYEYVKKLTILIVVIVRGGKIEVTTRNPLVSPYAELTETFCVPARLSCFYRRSYVSASFTDEFESRYVG